MLNLFVNLLIVPNRSREVVVHQREYGLDIAIVQPVWGSLQVPPRNPRKSMLGSEGPSTELSCNCGKALAAGGAKFLDLGKLTKDKGNPATYRLLAIERGQFAGGGRQDGWREKARLIRLDATRKYASHKNACRPRQTFRNSEMLLAEKSVWRNAPCPFFVSCFSPVAEDDVAPSWDLPWVSSQLICRRIHQAAPSDPGST